MQPSKLFLYVLSFLIFFPLQIYCQCNFPSGTYSWGKSDVDSYVSFNCSAAPLAIIIPTDAIISIKNNDAWDLTSYGVMTVTIQGSGSLGFNGTDQLILASGSSLIIENSSNTQALTESGNATNIRIQIGAKIYLGSDFPSIVAAGGADQGGVLPVELIFFYGKWNNNKHVVLSWQTASEINNSHFEVEHSLDGIGFTQIGKVKGSESTTLIQDYVFHHTPQSLTTHYYRLKQIDMDGQFEYSEIIHINTPDFIDFKVLTNTNRELSFFINEKANLKIIDSKGQLIEKRLINNGEVILPLHFLSNGQYFVIIETRIFQKVVKIVRFNKR